MGSLDLEEEERLLQMVHDFIESDSSTNTSYSSSYSCSLHNHHVRFGHSTRIRCFTLQEIMRNNKQDEKRITEKVEQLMRNKMDLEKNTRLKQWLVKCLKLDGLNASICHTSWLTTPGCPCGTYEYIEIMEQDANSKKLIVDIDFKSQFEVARPTQSYTKLSSKLPTIFVGNEDKLNNIISLLCSAAEESLIEKGLHVPPWRKANYMMSKWNLSHYCTNISDYNSSNIEGSNRGMICPNNNVNIDISNGNGNGYIPRRRRDMSGGSGLSNQFSNMSINCC